MKGTQFFVVSDTDFKLVQVRNSLKQSHQFNYCSVYLGPQRAKPINLAKPINFDRLLVNGCSMWVAWLKCTHTSGHDQSIELLNM